VRAGDDLAARVVDVVRSEVDIADDGNIAVICPASLVAVVTEAFEVAGLEFGRATRRGLDQQLTVVPVGLVKGLEVDAAVVVEPSRIIAEEAQGTRALYVALTRATKRLSVVHQDALPAVLQE
jgi:DNA helicase IV